MGQALEMLGDYLLTVISVHKKNTHAFLTAKKNCNLLSFKESSYSWKQLLVHVLTITFYEEK